MFDTTIKVLLNFVLIILTSSVVYTAFTLVPTKPQLKAGECAKVNTALLETWEEPFYNNTVKFLVLEAGKRKYNMLVMLGELPVQQISPEFAAFDKEVVKTDCTEKATDAQATETTNGQEE